MLTNLVFVVLLLLTGGGRLNGMGGGVSNKSSHWPNKQAQIESPVTIVVVNDMLFWLGPSVYLYFRFFPNVLSLDFDPTYLIFQIRDEGWEKILRPKDCVIKSWQLKTVGPLPPLFGKETETHFYTSICGPSKIQRDKLL